MKSVAEDEDVGSFVDVVVVAEAVVVLVAVAVLFDFGRRCRLILSGWVQIWIRRRVWDHVHRYFALDFDVPPFVSAVEDLVWEVRKMDLSK